MVDELEQLRDWTTRAGVAEKARVIAAIARLTAEDVDAVSALVWLLLPGACAIADGLRDLYVDIDALVAGQLWIEASHAYLLPNRRVAATILRRTRREVCAELGVGDLAKRRDRAWSQTRVVDQLDESLRAAESEPEPLGEVLALMLEAIGEGAILLFDAMLLDGLSVKAHELGAAAHRGRMGLTSPAVVEAYAASLNLSARALRRRASKALDHLAEYVAVREDPERFAVWKAQHRRPELTAAEEAQLALGIAEFCPALIALVRERDESLCDGRRVRRILAPPSPVSARDTRVPRRRDLTGEDLERRRA